MLIVPCDPLDPRRPDEHFAPEAVAARAAGDGFTLDALDAAAARLGTGPAVLRDHVKSLKRHWDEACFIPDTADVAGARAVATRFVELRGDEATGGFVLRRFERFVSAEVRTWWVGGTCALATAHPDTPDETLSVDGPDAVPSPVMEEVRDAVRALGLPFVTVDLVGRDDGRWRVVELGDGQVSDRPSSTDASALIAALAG